MEDNYNPKRPYLPTRKEIQRCCHRIQRSWTEHQRRERQVAGCRDVQVLFYSVASLGIDILSFEQDELETASSPY